MNLRPLRRLAFPFILLGAALTLKYAMTTPAEVEAMLDWLPWASLAMALILSAYHGDSRLFSATLAVIMVWYLVAGTLQTSLDEPIPRRIYSLISILFPLQVFYLLLVPERGLWNRHGAMTVTGVLAIALAGLMIFYFTGEEAFLRFIDEHLAVRPFPGYILSTNATMVMLAVALAGLYRLSTGNSEQEAALVMTTLFMYLLLVLFDWPEISGVMFSLVGLTLIISLVKSGYELAYVDELTDLPGRRALNDQLRGLGKKYVIAMVDVDHFKKFNDKHGHDTGDEVLRMVAKNLAAVGGGGKAYRYGGEEFCIVFPGKDVPGECEPYLEQVRMAIEQYEMILRDHKHRDVSEEEAQERRGRRAANRNGKTVAVTVSIGVAGADPSCGSPEDIVQVADRALYNAKKKGRNRLVAA
ncbi:MAG: GGDEF domain-containing protein [Pseudomonadales bacterium]|nr:GGDEF domain-containing protein [Pseudomonadales bacterium]